VAGELQIRAHAYLDSEELRRGLEEFEKRNPFLLSGALPVPSAGKEKRRQR
jgi:hypothetical protein